ncbi:hypothetical protein GCM10022243_66790 [Saccharothrix violaceirubra]|uniref:Uncharacterized protein n=1 Tax=Saccharothrix violaceirubra TaxID=413306 RepID=A0A7W7TBM3_9PSEU|nr:hypothetical protein [Saccharothrix violaceirubra]MBB4968835.1 hypothetical protein [Saccharothrix violaceirubra]
MAPRPLSVLEDEVFVEFGVFVLQEHFSPRVALAAGRPDVTEVVRAGPGGATFRSGGVDHLARVRVESWSGRYVGDDGTWEEAAAAVVEFDRVEVRLASVTAWVSDEGLVLPGPGRYVVDVRVSGRSRVPEWSGEPVHGVERWLVRLHRALD